MSLGELEKVYLSQIKILGLFAEYTYSRRNMQTFKQSDAIIFKTKDLFWIFYFLKSTWNGILQESLQA